MCYLWMRLWMPWVLAAPLLLAPVAAWPLEAPPVAGLPALGDGGYMTLGQERQLGDHIARAIFRDPAFLEDPVLDGYLQTLWQPLMAAAVERGDVSSELAERFAWRLLIARDRSVNAFALPGGYVGVHLGLMGLVGSADELASVLAHELSHVSQRHIARLLQRQEQQAPWVLATMILGALAAGAAGQADMAQAAIMGGQAVAAQTRLNFSRDMEREADRIGFGILTHAGFDGRGAVSMFERLQQVSRLNDDGAFPYLRSHPLTGERLADMQARLPSGSTASAQSDAVPPKVSPYFHAMMAARARVLAEVQVERLQALAGQLDATPSGGAAVELLGQRYAATLAAAQLRDLTRTQQGLEQLQNSVPNDPDALRALQWLELEILPPLLPRAPAAQAAAWRARLAQWQALHLQAGQRTGMLLAAQASLAGGAQQHTQAIQRLQAWTALHPHDGPAWQLLASLLAQQQQVVRAARAEAEARLAYLDMAGALDRFQAAQQLARQQQVDHIELSILDARRRDTERRWREQERDNARR